jgi:SM-20-related protein
MTAYQLPSNRTPETLSPQPVAPDVSQMSNNEAIIRKSVISGREVFVCDHLVDDKMVKQIGTLVKTLQYVRKEKSRPGVPGLAAVSDIPMERIPGDPFLSGLKQAVERLFPQERFGDQRAYVNCSVYGDTYYIHRDCGAHEQHVTALYYANAEWHPDWGGETIYYNDQEDAELAITPRPGRLVIARGALLHRGNVPTRNCYEERYTLAYKLNSLGPVAA